MSVHTLKTGQYETFKTTRQHKILVLDGKDYYAWVDTTQGHLLVLSDAEHQRLETLGSGDYVIFRPQDEPNFRDNLDHLELREGDRYHTYILPNGLPTSDDTQKKLVETDETLSPEEISSLTARP